VPRLDEVRIDAPALAFTALVALGSGVLFGLLPALRASRSDAGEALKEGGRTSTGAAGQGVRSALVVAEVSLSLVLLVGAGLLMRSFVRLQAVELGFDARGVLVAPLRLSEAAYPDSASVSRFYGTVIDHVRRLPGVASVAAVNSAPFAGVNPGLVYTVPDRPTPPGERPPDADYRVVTPGYLRTMGIRLLSGRDFTEQDTDRAPSVVLVSETTAGRTWPAENAIGRQIRIGDPVKGPVFTVVGVVADARYQSLETPEVRPMMYFSALARPQQGMMIVVRGANTGAMATGVREAIAAVDPRIPTPTMRAMDDLLGLVTSTRRFALGLFAVFAATALLLAAVGIYGVMSYLVRQRMHELGIRLALGAPARVLLMSVVGRALRLTMIGVGVGLAGAWGLTRVLAALLFEVGATDRPTFAAVAVLLVSAVAKIITSETRNMMASGCQPDRPSSAWASAATRPVFSIAPARLRPPPKRMSTSHGIFLRQFQSRMCVVRRRLAGMKKSSSATPRAMTSSVTSAPSVPAAAGFCRVSTFQISREIHRDSARVKAPATLRRRSPGVRPACVRVARDRRRTGCTGGPRARARSAD